MSTKDTPQKNSSAGHAAKSSKDASTVVSTNAPVFQGTSMSMKTAAIIILVLNALRIATGALFDLAPQEAYYFLYAQNLALSYFDHPPIMAWSLWLFTSIFGAHPIVLRLTAFVLTAGTQWLFYVLARRFLPASKAIHATVLFCTTAMVSVISLISLPDVPLLLFWTLSLVLLERAIFQGDKKCWLLAGLAMGVAFDGKYTAAMLQVGLGLFLVLSTDHRKWLKTPWPYLSIVLAHLAMAPVYIWNAQNGFASLLFQSADRASSWSGLHPINFLKLLGTQTALLLPALLLGICWAFKKVCSLWWHRRPLRMIRSKVLFLLCFFAPLFLGFTALSFITLVKPNWMMPAWITGIILAAMLLSRRVVRLNLGLSAVLHLAIFVELIWYPVPVKSDDTWFGWSQLAQEAQALSKDRPDHFVFSDDSYKTSAELGFYMKAKTYSSNILGKRGLQYDYLGDDLTALKGKNALFFDSQPRDLSERQIISTPPRKLVRHFEKVQELSPILIRNPQGQISRKFRVFDCMGYRGPQPLKDDPLNTSDQAGLGKEVERFALPDGRVVQVSVAGGEADTSEKKDSVETKASSAVDGAPSQPTDDNSASDKSAPLEMGASEAKGAAF